MSKKKRKTRREKETLTVHQFGHETKNVITAPVVAAVSEEEGDKLVKKTKVVEPHVMKDLKKVLTIIGIVIGFVVVMSLLAYYTNILNGLFGYFHIKY